MPLPGMMGVRLGLVWGGVRHILSTSCVPEVVIRLLDEIGLLLNKLDKLNGRSMEIVLTKEHLQKVAVPSYTVRFGIFGEDESFLGIWKDAWKLFERAATLPLEILPVDAEPQINDEGTGTVDILLRRGGIRNKNYLKADKARLNDAVRAVLNSLELPTDFTGKLRLHLHLFKLRKASLITSN